MDAVCKREKCTCSSVFGTESARGGCIITGCRVHAKLEKDHPAYELTNDKIQAILNAKAVKDNAPRPPPQPRTNVKDGFSDSSVHGQMGKPSPLPLEKQKQDGKTTQISTPPSPSSHSPASPKKPRKSLNRTMSRAFRMQKHGVIWKKATKGFFAGTWKKRTISLIPYPRAPPSLLYWHSKTGAADVHLGHTPKSHFTVRKVREGEMVREGPGRLWLFHVVVTTNGWWTNCWEGGDLAASATASAASSAASSAGSAALSETEVCYATDTPGEAKKWVEAITAAFVPSQGL